MSNEFVYVLRLARAEYSRIKAWRAKYEADVRDWYENGDGRPVDQGGKGYRFPCCIHGANLWVEHDIPCGACEMGDPRDSWLAAQNAAHAYQTFRKRVDWVLSCPMGSRPDSYHELIEWAHAPVQEILTADQSLMM